MKEIETLMVWQQQANQEKRMKDDGK